MKVSKVQLITKALVVLSLISFTFTFSSSVFAQDGVKDNRYGGYARLYSMGDNPYIVDPDNIKYNSAYSSIYSNFFWGDIGGNNGNPEDGIGQFVGFNYQVSKGLTLGALLTRNDSLSGSSIASLDPNNLVALVNSNSAAAVVPLNNNFTLLGSYGFGNFTVGLGVSYASTTNDFKPATGNGDKNSASQFGINVSTIGKISSSFSLDAAFSLSIPSATYTPGTGDKVEASATNLMFNARGFFKLGGKFSLVPTVMFYNSTGTYKVGSNSTDLPTTTGIGVGAGLVYQSGSLLISGGPAFMYESQTISSVSGVSPELSDSRIVFPAWNLGAEWQFTEWLVGRAGYVASTFSLTNQSIASPTTVDENTRTGFGKGDVRLGVGFRFGGFTLDATVNDDVLRQGFNLVGGGVRSFAYLSGSFAF
ncbi:MAG: hypothetical protein ACUVRG_04710 [Ignavibacterium sp.]|uniref:hypothetical protein n=1 Tax=Ignavibacterium sp. TaxID=2651167 RepID=UPI00404B3E08